MKHIIIFLLLFLPAFYKNYAQINTTDSLALVDLYNSTGGPSWNNHSNWLTGPVQNWHGIGVSGNRVTEVRFSFNNLTGPLPASISNISQLRMLEITFNNLSGNLPSELSNLVNLESLSLESNNFTGSIPESYGDFPNLKGLGVQLNKLSGPVPISLKNLSSQGCGIMLFENNFTFDGLETLVPHFAFLQIRYDHQGNLPLHLTNGALSVYAGGTLSNNTYTWYRNGQQVAVITGDSTYIPTEGGAYSVMITNALIPVDEFNGLILRSDIVQVGVQPVTLVDFSVIKQNTNAVLKWRTASEINAASFAVQRSTDGSNFITIGTIKATNAGNRLSQYQFTDDGLVKLKNNCVYYRLAQEDRDGQINFSKTVALIMPSEKTFIQPNPIHNTINIFVKYYTGKLQLSISDVQGRKIISQLLTAVNGKVEPLQANKLPTGIYFASITINGSMITEKIYKQ